MKLISLLLIGLFYVPQVNWNNTPVDARSKVSFKIRNFGFLVDGKFSGLRGKIYYNPARISDMKIDVTLDAASIDTDNRTRDGHLRGPDYFDVKNHPQIRFVSAGINAGNLNTLTGNLTIKNITRKVSFPFTVSSIDGGYRFRGKFSINRRDFGVGGFSTVSDNVTISLDVFTKSI